MYVLVLVNFLPQVALKWDKPTSKQVLQSSTFCNKAVKQEDTKVCQEQDQ